MASVSESEQTTDKLDACCLTEYRPLAGVPKGSFVKIGNIDTYQCLSSNSLTKGKAIVLLTDIFGKESLYGSFLTWSRQWNVLFKVCRKILV